MSSKSTVSLREIAEKTRLSVTTVSRALRRRGEISEETRRRVLEAAESMRYRPNLLVQGIQTGKTRTMGVMVPPYDSYWTDVLYGIHEEMTAADHVYINAWCEQEDEDEYYSAFMLQQLHRLIDRRVDGVIVWPHLAPLYTEHIEELECRNLPVVTVDHEIPLGDAVETDENSGAVAVAQHLLDLGHMNIAQVAWDDSYKWAQRRRLYFEQEIKASDANYVTVVTHCDEEVGRLTRELMDRDPRPTAIFACSDRVARLIYRTLGELGLRIPDDVSVVGFADLDFAQWMAPALTTVRQDGRKMGKAAARLLIDRSEGKAVKGKPNVVQVACELIVRDSTAKPSTTN
ncbi:MAG: LacI family DNA-binding transcriptional regulator [Sedimentisphaerales bacterium]|nr:LacI family DNA-binding transcriptional regulator [Sedimentisphaerales bacterium]